jgi:CubicO group peptidase (beta-lactamase class C family)
MQYRKWENKMDPSLKAIRPLPQAILFPLLFAPGDAWEYSVGIDWAGQMVERVNDNISLEDYMHKNIWGPLGVQNFTFHPKSAPHVLERMIDMNEREGGINPIFSIAANPDGKVGYTDNTIWNWETPGCHGGAGSFGNMLDYQKMLHSICSDDGKLLKSSTIDEMFTPQLSSASRESLLQKLAIPELNQLYGGMPLGVKVDWGLGGQMLMEDLKGERRKGTMVWGGYPNLIWFCDRFGGMSGIYGSQLNPPGDLKTVELVTAWIKELYSKAGKAKL